MSVDLLNEFYDTDCAALTSGERTVLTYLCWKASDEGEAWPSKDTVASATNQHIRNVQRAYASLLDRGVLVPTGDPSQGWRTARVKVVLAAIPEKENPGAQPGGTLAHSHLNPGAQPLNPGCAPPNRQDRQEKDILTDVRPFGSDPDQANPFAREPDPKPMTNTQLTDYFVEALKRAVTDYGAKVTGSTDRGLFSKNLTTLRNRDGLSSEEIKAMIDAYRIGYGRWNMNIARWKDFFSSGTLTWTRDMAVTPAGNRSAAQDVEDGAPDIHIPKKPSWLEKKS